MEELPATFGKYYLTEKLATGGMAEIYLGKILGPGGFEKQLVIKQIHPRLSGERQFVDMFVAEAKMLVTLAHGNIVPVYELGVVDDVYFIAMEYIDGPTLYRFTEAAARRGLQLPSAVAAWIAAEILEGLDYAHRKGEGVIHRDLSPRNVMLSRDGEVKLVDFGIAVSLGATGDKDGSAPTGSFPYMSPEQVRREPLDGQSDLFSVGVLLWEMLTGQRLFARSNADDTLTAVLEGDILLPSTIRPSVPARLDEAVAKALARDKSLRWPSAGDFLAALNRHLYSLDKNPGARDLAPLVAKLCPPELRRLSTEGGGGDRDASAPFVLPTAEQPNANAPSTQVMARDDSQPRAVVFAKQKSFATHVEWKQVLERATPLLGTPALGDTDVGPTTKVTPKGGPAPLATSARSTTQTAALVEAGIGTAQIEKIPPPIEPERTEPPPRAPLPRRLLIGLGLAAAAIIGVTARLACTPGPASIDAQVVIDAAPPAADAAFTVTSPDAVIVVAPGVDAAPARIDAAPPRRADARTLDPADARPRRADAEPTGPPIDARARPTPDAAVATATGTLKVGATPWGKVTIDGKPLTGSTPKTLTLSAGTHTVLVEYTGSDPPQRETRKVEVRAGEVVTATFTFTE
jgi:serine/threonine protein kinase